MRNVTVNIPDAPKQLMKILLDAGYEAYVVGGCVRDFLLGREPHDWDICTNALPEQMKSKLASSMELLQSWWIMLDMKSRHIALMESTQIIGIQIQYSLLVHFTKI